MKTLPLFLAGSTPRWLNIALQQSLPSLIWAAIIIVFLVFFKSQIKRFIENLGSISLKTKWFEVALQHVASDLVKAVMTRQLAKGLLKNKHYVLPLVSECII